MPTMAAAGRPVDMLIRNVPIRTPAAARYPNQSVAAMASPVGGQTGETLICRKANDKPSFAAQK